MINRRARRLLGESWWHGAAGVFPIRLETAAWFARRPGLPKTQLPVVTCMNTYVWTVHDMEEVDVPTIAPYPVCTCTICSAPVPKACTVHRTICTKNMYQN